MRGTQVALNFSWARKEVGLLVVVAFFQLSIKFIKCFTEVFFLIIHLFKKNFFDVFISNLKGTLFEGTKGYFLLNFCMDSPKGVMQM